jgi:purine-nucleoside phosphorylase
MTSLGPPASLVSPSGFRVLVVSAFAPELAPLRRHLRHLRQLRQAEPRGSAAEVDEVDARLVSVGIGLVEAAIGTARVLADGRGRAPDALIFCGTAGAYGRDLAPGRALVVADELVLVSSAVVGRQAYLPERVPTRVPASRRLSQSLLAAARRVSRPDGGAVEEGAVASPLAITRDARLARALAAATSARAENLEVFAVARAALAWGVPFAAVLGIANRVGPAAHSEWQTHQAAASAMACAAIAELLRTGHGRARRGTRATVTAPSPRR